MKSKQIGTFGEKMAGNYLKKNGYQILDRNYFFRIPGGPKKGEIDIIAKKSGIISFIEVKTLSNPDLLIRPEEKINFSKQKRLRKTAESWLMKNKIPLDTKWQIDIMAIEINSSKKIKISYFENAIPYQ